MPTALLAGERDQRFPERRDGILQRGADGLEALDAGAVAARLEVADVDVAKAGLAQKQRKLRPGEFPVVTIRVVLAPLGRLRRLLYECLFSKLIVPVSRVFQSEKGAPDFGRDNAARWQVVQAPNEGSRRILFCSKQSVDLRHSSTAT